jgi:hypothetical protein
MRSLYFATLESSVSSLVIVSGSIFLVTGIIFALGNLELLVTDTDFRFGNLFVRLSSYSFGFVTPISSALACFYLFRKVVVLCKCRAAIRALRREEERSADLIAVQRITEAQVVITSMRAIASGAAAVALPWFVLTEDTDFGDPVIYLALGSVLLQVLSFLLLTILEYFVLYPLDPLLGEYVCEAFRDEIIEEEIKFGVDDRTNFSMSPFEIKSETRGYIARSFIHRYRFDTVFNADRFGAIFHYLVTLHSPSDLFPEYEPPRATTISSSIAANNPFRAFVYGEV